MNQSNTKKLAIAGILCAVAVVGSLFTFPVLASKCAPSSIWSTSCALSCWAPGTESGWLSAPA